MSKLILMKHGAATPNLNKRSINGTGSGDNPRPLKQSKLPYTNNKISNSFAVSKTPSLTSLHAHFSAVATADAVVPIDTSSVSRPRLDHMTRNTETLLTPFVYTHCASLLCLWLSRSMVMYLGSGQLAVPVKTNDVATTGEDGIVYDDEESNDAEDSEEEEEDHSTSETDEDEDSIAGHYDPKQKKLVKLDSSNVEPRADFLPQAINLQADGSAFPDLPRSTDVWKAITHSITVDKDLSDTTRRAMLEYVTRLPGVLASSREPTAEEVQHQEKEQIKLKKRLQAVLKTSKVSKHQAERLKQPSGWLGSATGAILFYPPSTVSNAEKGTLVRGSWTMNNLLSSGLTDERKCIIDRYPLAIGIPYDKHAFANRPFYQDSTLGSKACAREVFQLLTEDFNKNVKTRIRTEGLDVVFGLPAQLAYDSAGRKLVGWSKHTFRARLDCPGISNSAGTYPPGSSHFVFHIYFTRRSQGITFGKLVVQHAHPCNVAARRGLGLHLSVFSWRESVIMDALLDLLMQSTQNRAADRSQNGRLFASYAVPSTAKLITRAVITALRSQEIQLDDFIKPEELGPDVLKYLETVFKGELDYSASAKKSLIAQACSIFTSRGRATLGKAGVGAAIKKGWETTRASGNLEKRKANITKGKLKPIPGDFTSPKESDAHLAEFRELVKLQANAKPLGNLRNNSRAALNALRNKKSGLQRLVGSQGDWAGWPENWKLDTARYTVKQSEYIGTMLLKGEIKWVPK